jgi:hypothetical protein
MVLLSMLLLVEVDSLQLVQQHQQHFEVVLVLGFFLIVLLPMVLMLLMYWVLALILIFL